MRQLQRAHQMALLQWGRDLAVTETLGCGITTCQRRSFNGAVTLRSRKPDRAREQNEMGFKLQWGRDLAVTETLGISRTLAT